MDSYVGVFHLPFLYVGCSIPKFLVETTLNLKQKQILSLRLFPALLLPATSMIVIVLYSERFREEESSFCASSHIGRDLFSHYITVANVKTAG